MVQAKAYDWHDQSLQSFYGQNVYMPNCDAFHFCVLFFSHYSSFNLKNWQLSYFATAWQFTLSHVSGYEGIKIQIIFLTIDDNIIIWNNEIISYYEILLHILEGLEDKRTQ